MHAFSALLDTLIATNASLSFKAMQISISGLELTGFAMTQPTVSPLTESKA